MNRRAGGWGTHGLRAALPRTLPGRAILVGVAIKLAIVFLRGTFGVVPAFINVVETVAGLAVAVGLTYFAFQLFVLAKRRLLWRVRRKLILSYIFVGFVPALLLLAFSLLCAFLLFYNLSSYLVQSRLRAMSDQARVLAQATLLEIERSGGSDAAAIAKRRVAGAAGDYPDASMVVLPIRRTCDQTGDSTTASTGPPAIAGPWAHVAAPRTVPAWIPCSGIAAVFAYTHRGLAESSEPRTHLVARAVSFGSGPRPTYAVIVDFLVNDAALQQLRRETGVELKNVSPLTGDNERAHPMAGTSGADDADNADRARSGMSGVLSSLPSLMEYRDWESGAPGTLTVTSGVSVGELYDRISRAEGRVGQRFGQGLLLVLFVIGALFLIIQFIALVAGLALARSITGSVHELFTGTERVRQGDFTHKIAVRSDDQLGELAGSFNSMTASIEDLLIQAAEKKRLEEELRIAHEIQMSLLPQGPLSMPGLSITALCVPAREVGGDYYDLLPLGEHRLGVLIADVSGKGTSAALYMAELKGLVLSLSEIHTSPRSMLIAANRIIAQHLDARSFITMTYAVIDLQARSMTYARAGHTPLIHVPGHNGRARILAPDGLVVGLKIDNGELFERLLQEDTIALGAGDVYVFFTDGISEAMNARDDCFGENRLGQLVETHAHLPPDELRERVLREIAAFVGDAPQHDDMTMILLKVDEVVEAVA